MDVTYIKDKHLTVLAILKEDNRGIWVFNKNNMLLGHYDKDANWTMRKDGSMVGKGNLTSQLY
jgi:hypothetical protein